LLVQGARIVAVEVENGQCSVRDGSHMPILVVRLIGRQVSAGTVHSPPGTRGSQLPTGSNRSARKRGQFSCL
jgi:hypothetical protein